MTNLNISAALKHVAVAVVSVIFLAGCLSTTPNVEEASATGGDFSLLTCEQLNEAESTLSQQFAFASNPTPPAFAATTASGEALREQISLVENTIIDLETKSRANNCASASPVVTSAQVLAETEEQAETMALTSGQYLQVGTFIREGNRDTTMQRYQAAGLPVIDETVVIGGRSYSRVLVGPLADRDMLRRADAIANELGLQDSFFVVR